MKKSPDDAALDGLLDFLAASTVKDRKKKDKKDDEAILVVAEEAAEPSEAPELPKLSAKEELMKGARDVEEVLSTADRIRDLLAKKKDKKAEPEAEATED